MSSQQKITANRANSLKSTGPRTRAGKAASRNNAYRHGMRSRTVVMPDEDYEQYNRLYNGICQEFPSPTLHEQFLVKQMADAQWRLERLKGIEAALLDEPEIDTAELDRISRWQVRMENSYYKAYKELKALQELREENLPKDQKEALPRTLCVYWLNRETGVRTQISGPAQEYDPALDPVMNHRPAG